MISDAAADHLPVVLRVAHRYAQRHTLPVWLDWQDLVAAGLERIDRELRRLEAAGCDGPLHLHNWATWGMIDYIRRVTHTAHGERAKRWTRDDLPGRAEVLTAPDPWHDRPGVEPAAPADAIAQADARDLIVSTLAAMPPADRRLLIAQYLEHRSVSRREIHFGCHHGLDSFGTFFVASSVTATSTLST